jgi:metal-sulfur cluster biosynthetic enzyme
MTTDTAFLLAQLERVVEPCSLSMGTPMSICDMGLVEELRFERGVVYVALCLTDPGCINYPKIRQFITDVLMEVPEVEAVQVRLSTTQLWTPDRVRPRAADQTVHFVRAGTRTPNKRGET